MFDWSFSYWNAFVIFIQFCFQFQTFFVIKHMFLS